MKEHYNDFGHKESRHGYAATGVYYVALPDGRFQTVRYTADKHGRIWLFITWNRRILNSLLHIFQDSIPKLSTTEVQATQKKSPLTENQVTPLPKKVKIPIFGNGDGLPMKHLLNSKKMKALWVISTIDVCDWTDGYFRMLFVYLLVKMIVQCQRCMNDGRKIVGINVVILQ